MDPDNYTVELIRQDIVKYQLQVNALIQVNIYILSWYIEYNLNFNVDITKLWTVARNMSRIKLK